MSTFDRYYSDDLSEKVKKGVKGCFEAGYWPQKEKIGYYRDKNTKSKALLIDKTQAPIIKRIFERASTGMYTLKELQEDAVELGLRTTKGGKPTIEKIRQILNDTFYYGWMRWKYNKETDSYLMEGPGIHEPIVSSELFERAKEARKNKPEQSHDRKEFPYKPILKCDICGCPVTAELKKKKIKSTGNIKYYILYHCTNTKGKHDKVRSINQNDLENLFYDKLLDLHLPSESANEIS